MKLTEFDYNLPEELIAQAPKEPRDHSRLLVLDRKTGAITHHTFYDIINYLNPGDVLVVNNSKVFPARLFGHRADTGGKVEILLNKNMTESFSVIPAPMDYRGKHPAGIQDSENSIWEAIGKNLKPKTQILFDGSDLEATVIERKDKISKLKFNLSGDEFFSEIEKIGHTPLPPYIKKSDTKKDKADYQTVYAKSIGSTAAPTAGLHLTERLLRQIKAKGVEIVEVTLHVGLGTFQPVEVKKIEDHQIHSEYYTVIPNELKKIVKAKKEGHRIIAVGTTTTRVLETIFSEDNNKKLTTDLLTTCLPAGKDDNLLSGFTQIFIYPGYKFECIDGLITNFHLPNSTLLMLASAFAGKDNIDLSYKEAIKQKYRFFSYGDAMLII